MFAGLVGVSKHTLFYYDKLNIFSPMIKDENGFRYYSFHQIEPFFVIKSLKEMGMPLGDIKTYLDSRTPERFLEILKENELLLSLEIERLISIKNLISQKQDAISSYMEGEKDRVQISKLDDEFLFLTESIPETQRNSIEVSFAEHIKRSQKTGINLPYSVGQITRLEDIRNKEYSNYTYFYTKVDSSSSGSSLKEGGYYITYNHSEGYKTVARAYDTILEFARENGLILGERFYEDVILDELSVAGYDNFVIKISILIRSDISKALLSLARIKD